MDYICIIGNWNQSKREKKKFKYILRVQFTFSVWAVRGPEIKLLSRKEITVQLIEVLELLAQM